MRRFGILALTLVASALTVAATGAGGASAAKLTLENGAQNGTGANGGVPLEVGETFTMEATASFDFGAYNVVCNNAGIGGFVQKNQKAVDELRVNETYRQFRSRGEYGEGYCTVNGIPTFSSTADVALSGGFNGMSLDLGANGVATLKNCRLDNDKKDVEFAFAVPSLSSFPPFFYCWYGAANFKGQNDATALSVTSEYGEPLTAEFTDQRLKRGYVDEDSTPGYCPKTVDAAMKLTFAFTGKHAWVHEHI